MNLRNRPPASAADFACRNDSQTLREWTAKMTIELVAVDDAATREAARDLIAEYLRWIASVAAASYGLSFDIDAMVTSDIEDRAKFYPPSGRFYVIRREDANIGVGCLKRITPSVAEIQRMYVQPHV